MAKKKVLYFSNSRFPVATIAGAIHTGQFPAIKDLDAGSFQNFPFLNMKSGGEGEIIVMGKDEWDNDIYALSIKGERGLPYRLIESFMRIYEIPRSNLLVVDSKVGDNWFLLAGCKAGFFTPLGCFFTCTGIKKIYTELILLIAGVRDSLAKSLD